MSHPPPSPSLPLSPSPHLFIEAAAPFDLYACGMCVRGPAAVRADGEGGGGSKRVKAGGEERRGRSW